MTFQLNMQFCKHMFNIQLLIRIIHQNMKTTWQTRFSVGLIYTLKVYIVHANLVHLEVKREKREEADCLVHQYKLT